MKEHIGDKKNICSGITWFAFNFIALKTLVHAKTLLKRMFVSDWSFSPQGGWRKGHQDNVWQFSLEGHSWGHEGNLNVSF